VKWLGVARCGSVWLGVAVRSGSRGGEQSCLTDGGNVLLGQDMTRLNMRSATQVRFLYYIFLPCRSCHLFLPGVPIYIKTCLLQSLYPQTRSLYTITRETLLRRFFILDLVAIFSFKVSGEGTLMFLPGYRIGCVAERCLATLLRYVIVFSSCPRLML
jgi:hypothetical protein